MVNFCFRECREALKKLRGEEFSYPVLAFHGTNQEFITPICETGFKVPGRSCMCLFGLKVRETHQTNDSAYQHDVIFFAENVAMP